MKLVFATHNKHKFKEVKLLMPKHIELVSLDDINCTEDIEETGKTFQENSLLKAQYIFEKYKLNCVADDSGIEVEALGGAPGVYSARYAGEHKSDADNNQKLLKELADKTNRNACFKAVITLLIAGKAYFFEGLIKGEILYKGQGTEGFGYDPLFKPLSHSKSFAQLSTEEKLTLSHRAIAVNKLVDFLKQNKL